MYTLDFNNDFCCQCRYYTDYYCTKHDSITYPGEEECDYYEKTIDF